ncbi:MAG: hypothetical protein KDA22_16810, partial [Phycisphaerales bacterium]|nr:hypothetical protein [Phycisphaerales bacterium]
ALAFLDHCRIRTDPADSAVAAPELSAAERAVERLALRVLAQYFSGEMDFGDIPPTPPPEAPPDDGDAPVPQPA